MAKSMRFLKLPSLFSSTKGNGGKQKAEPTVEDKYTLTSTVLGKGSYATVCLGQERKTGKVVAIKVIDKSHMTPKEKEKLQAEVTILRALNHPNVVKIFDSYEEGEKYFIVMEHVTGGELFTQIVDKERIFNEEETRRIVRTLALALKHCKDKGVIHRDIKPENILLTAEEEVKLVDFNLSKKVDNDMVNYSILETMCGTPNYVAPEVISGKPYDYKCDIWSLGVITYLLLSGGYLPFFVNPKTEGREGLLRKVREGKWSFTPPKAWDNVSENGKDFIRRILRKDPESRLTYEQLLNHKWLKSTSEDYTQNRIDTSELAKFNDKRKLLVTLYIQDAANKFGDLMLDHPEEQIDEEDIVDKFAGDGFMSGTDGFNISFE